MTGSDIEFEFDQVKLYFGMPYKLTSMDNVELHQPTILDIINADEKEFYDSLYSFAGNSTMYRLQLWNVGIDWNKISDYDLFLIMYKTLSPKFCNLILGENFNLLNFEIYDKELENKDGEIIIEKILVDENSGIQFNEENYIECRDFLRNVFNFFPKYETTKSRIAKEALIEEEKEKLEIAKKEKDKEDSSQSNLLPLISFAINHPGFSYTLEELGKMPVYRFMDSIKRLNIYERTKALNNGLYCGMADLSKVDEKLFDFARNK